MTTVYHSLPPILGLGIGNLNHILIYSYGVTNSDMYNVIQMN